VTGRSAGLQAGLAVAGLLAAHLTWQREPERAPGEVTIIDASKADVARVRYEDDDNILGLERQTEDGEPGIRLHVEAKTKAPASKAGAASPGRPASPARELRGNADALKLADRFAPFVAPRAFGVIDGPKLKELGLEAPTRHLELLVRGDTRKYDIGVAANAQNGEAFLRDTRDGRVYLMPRQLLTDLSNARRLVDARLHAFETKDFDHLTLSVNGKRKDYVHVGRENAALDGYAPAKTPDKRDQMVKNWADALWRAFPMEVLGKGEEPKSGTFKTVFRVEYTDKGKPVGWTEIGRLETEAASGTGVAAAEVAENIYARTEHSIGWSRLHSGDQLITDAEKLATAP
jgi:hypothetical protein